MTANGKTRLFFDFQSGHTVDVDEVEPGKWRTKCRDCAYEVQSRDEQNAMIRVGFHFGRLAAALEAALTRKPS